MSEPLRIPVTVHEKPYTPPLTCVEITPDLARRCGLPLALSFDGHGNPRWHWMPQ